MSKIFEKIEQKHQKNKFFQEFSKKSGKVMKC